MPQKYVDYFSWLSPLIDWIVVHSTIVGVFFMALISAIIRSFKDGKIDFIEAIYCALIAVGLSTALSAFNLPESLCWLVAVFIGSVGSQWFRKNATKVVEARLTQVEAKVNAIQPKDDNNANQ